LRAIAAGRADIVPVPFGIVWSATALQERRAGGRWPKAGSLAALVRFELRQGCFLQCEMGVRQSPRLRAGRAEHCAYDYSLRTVLNITPLMPRRPSAEYIRTAREYDSLPACRSMLFKHDLHSLREFMTGWRASVTPHWRKWAIDRHLWHLWR
jgi:hypothetical protein